MVDWTAPMSQTFEYYVVNPNTWKDVKQLNSITSSNITRDSTVDTLGSASINSNEMLGEAYVRIYLVTIQNGVREKHPLATVLVQTPSSKFDGLVTSVTMDAYTPLIELKENQPPIGYFVPEDSNIMDQAYNITFEHLRAPVVAGASDVTMYKDFVSNSSDTWLTFLSDLLANAKFKFDLDEMGRVLFAPDQDTASMQPVWTYDDGNSSILYPNVTVDHDLYGVPNVVEVVYSDSRNMYVARAVNDEASSPTSIINRGREITTRIEDPDMSGTPTQYVVEEYAREQLRSLSTLEYTISYTHAYNGVRLGDAVRLDYKRAGLNGVKARVISQTIKCEPGCPVTEKARFTVKLWEE